MPICVPSTFLANKPESGRNEVYSLPPLLARHGTYHAGIHTSTEQEAALSMATAKASPHGRAIKQKASQLVVLYRVTAEKAPTG